MLSLGILALFAPLAGAGGRPEYTKNYYVTGDVVTEVSGMRGTGVKASRPALSTSAECPRAPTLSLRFVLGNRGKHRRSVGGERLFSVGPTGSVPTASNAIVGAVRGDSSNTACWSSGGTGGASIAVRRGASTAPMSSDTCLLIPPTMFAWQMARYTVKPARWWRQGNGNTSTNGASLVVVYRVLTPGTPLRAVVIYDGAYTMTKFSPGMTQTIGGIYHALWRGRPR